jgi:Lon protease-like protein
VGVGEGDSECAPVAVEKLAIESGQLGDLVRGVARLAAGELTLHRQQREAILGGGAAQLLERNAVGGKLLQQPTTGISGSAIESIEQPLGLEVDLGHGEILARLCREQHVRWLWRVPTYNPAMTGGGVEIPIFELPVVLLPGELLPLHIFEERYKRMIGDCLDAGEPFGIVFRDSEGSARRIGCEARIAEVTERFDDGRMNIVVAGERPFRVLDRFEAPRYPAADIDPVDAAEEERDPGDPSAGEAEGARETFAELVRRVGAEPPDEEAIAASDSYALAARVELPAETKQKLLELRSERERMRVLHAAFRALLRALERSREIAARARMNGKVIVG